MADRSLVIRIGANVTGLVAGMRTAKQATEDLAVKGLDRIAKHEQSIHTVSNAMGALGIAAVGVAGLAVRAFADFDQAMSSVQASTMESADNMALLREAAIDAGQRTAYSATEAAGAIEELAKAGVSTADILGGGLDGALDLAAAGGIAVGEAAETAASAMTQFGLEGRDVTRIADLLAAGAGKAQGGVSDLGAALNQSGLVAAQMGLSVEETVGSLAAFASAGLIGSDAGTSFRAMLLRLANPTGEAAEKMRELGIQAYDAQGNFVGMEALAGELREGLGGLTQEQRNATLALLFGQDAIRTSAILYEQGSEGVAKWNAAVDEQGYAAEVAATRMDNLKGDIEEFTGALETAFINAGEGGNDALRSLVQGATEVVNKFSELPDGVQQATLGIVGSGGFALLGVAALGRVATSVAELRTAFVNLGVSARTARIAVAGVGLALGAGVYLLSEWAAGQAEARARTEEFRDTLDSFGNTTDDTVRKINESLSSDRNNWVDGLFGRDPKSLIDQAEQFGLAVEDLQGYILGQADAVERVNAATEEYLAIERRGATARNDAELAVRALLDPLNEESRLLTNSQKEQAQKALADEAAGVAQDDLGDSYATTTTQIDQQVEALEGLLDAQREQRDMVLGLRDANRGYESALAAADAALEANGATLDITTEKGRANQEALDGIVEAGARVIDSLRENGASQEELQAAMQRTRDDFIAFQTQAGLSAEEAAALADELGLIPANVPITVQANTAAATEQIEAFRLRYAGKSIGEVSMQIRLEAPNMTAAQRAEAVRYTAQAAAFANRGRAAGGRVTGRASYLVGENGPEIFQPDVSGTVLSHGISRGRMYAGGMAPAPASAPAQMGGFSGPLVNVERVVQGTPQDVGREVQWVMMARGM